MHLRFVKASPCKNTTVFVEDDVPVAMRPAVARVAMETESLGAEQVGWIVRPKDSRATLRLEMVGGEFCGNASLALGALAASRGLVGVNEKFCVECSGAKSPLSVIIAKNGDGRWKGRITLPQMAEISEVVLSAFGVRYHGSIVALPGITHFFVESEPFGTDVYDALLCSLCRARTADAYGVIPFRFEGANAFSIKPYVAVPSVNSRVFEKACGSGSLALGHLISATKGISRLEVFQPGGVIEVDMGEAPSISEDVCFPCEGTFFVDDNTLRSTDRCG